MSLAVAGGDLAEVQSSAGLGGGAAGAGTSDFTCCEPGTGCVPSGLSHDGKSVGVSPQRLYTAWSVWPARCCEDLAVWMLETTLPTVVPKICEGHFSFVSGSWA